MSANMANSAIYSLGVDKWVVSWTQHFAMRICLAAPAGEACLQVKADNGVFAGNCTNRCYLYLYIYLQCKRGKITDTREASFPLLSAWGVKNLSAFGAWPSWDFDVRLLCADVLHIAGSEVGTWDVGLATLSSQPWHCPVISEIGDRISRVNCLGK